jgi:hypothetical protein
MSAHMPEGSAETGYTRMRKIIEQLVETNIEVFKEETRR